MFELENEDEDFRLIKKTVLHAKHYILPILSITLIFFIATNVFLQMSKQGPQVLITFSKFFSKEDKALQKSSLSNQQLIVEPSASPSVTETPTVTMKIYTYIAKKGDSKIKLARQSLQEYTLSEGIPLSKSQRSYAETILADDYADIRLTPGMSLSFSEYRVLEVVELALTHK